MIAPKSYYARSKKRLSGAACHSNRRGGSDKHLRMGHVLRCKGAASDPKIHDLFETADVDSSVIRWVIADLANPHIPFFLPNLTLHIFAEMHIMRRRAK